MSEIRITSYDEAERYVQEKGIDDHGFHRYLKEFLSYKPESFALIKIGGESIANPESLAEVSAVLACLSHLGLYPVVVHGAGPQIDAEYKKRGIEPEKYRGLRITNDMKPVLSGYTTAHSALVRAVSGSGGMVSSLKESRIFPAEKMRADVDLGYVGEIKDANILPIQLAVHDRRIPVVLPIGYDYGDNGPIFYNLNADHAVQSLCHKMSPEKVIFMTEVGGVYDDGSLVSCMTLDDLGGFISNGSATGGMGIKIDVARNLLCNGTSAIQISSPQNLVYELFTEEGRGTCIRR